MKLEIETSNKQAKMLIDYCKRHNIEISDTRQTRFDLSLYEDQILTKNDFMGIYQKIQSGLFSSVIYKNECKIYKINIIAFEKYMTCFIKDNIKMKYKIIKGQIKCLGFN